MACMGKGEIHYGFLMEKLKEGDDVECLGVYGSIILNGLLVTKLHIGLSGF